MTGCRAQGCLPATLLPSGLVPAPYTKGSIAFKKKIFVKTCLSRLGQFGREATEREHFFWCIGKLEQRLLDLVGQCLKSREIMLVGVLLFELLPKLLNWVVVRRISRQLDDLHPCRLLGEEGLGLGAGVILCPILNQNDVLR